MARVNITDVEVMQNPTKFTDKFYFKITFECFEPLEEDLDQTLDSIVVGPIPVGRHQFLFDACSPDSSKIPPQDLVGVTVVLIQAFYRNNEFIRVGYYVNNEYTDEDLRLDPPKEPIIEKLERHIIASDPRITRFPIDWGDGLLDGCPEPVQESDNENEVNDCENDLTVSEPKACMEVDHSPMVVN